MAKAKEVMKNEPSEMISAEMPAWMKSDSVRGQEGVGVDDLTIPRLSLIQDLSPQRKKSDPAYIDGADSGMLFNNVTLKLYGESVVFVPCFYRKEWVIWKSQNSGGGFQGSFSSEKEALAEFREKDYEGKIDKKGDPEYEINDTGQQFGIVVHENGFTEDIVISLAKSKRKVDRQFNTLVKMAGGDRFSKMYKISAVGDQNAAGQDYFNFGVTAMGFVADEALYNKAVAMYEAVSAGSRDVNRDSEEKKKEEY
jgi:hypothetical protein